MIEAAKKFMDTYGVLESQILQDIPSKTVFRTVIPFIKGSGISKSKYTSGVFTFVEMNGEGQVALWTDDILKISPLKLHIAQQKVNSFNERLGMDIAHIDADNDARIKIISKPVNSSLLYEQSTKIYGMMVQLSTDLYNQLKDL